MSIHNNKKKKKTKKHNNKYYNNSNKDVAARVPRDILHKMFEDGVAGHWSTTPGGIPWNSF